ncbi:hypothetical protein [Pseudomonas cichorii]|uniref:hypothetical protein n=1 Tax=Pseudomonas cichorii TaxID=36746 RepID=UPI001C88FD98|nr:hypothetical protein [Pseudomonas cichorii]MBX8493785.1 hypothetical protein [Pseudomonas cichorii]
MFGSRTRHSTAQFLGLQEIPTIRVLLEKHGIDASEIHHRTIIGGLALLITQADDKKLKYVLDEVTRTYKDLRSHVSPKERFDERYDDLKKCLLLDGFVVENKQLLMLDPSIRDAPPVDDELIAVLQQLGLPRCDGVIQKINDSTDAFRRPIPDFNASLANARVSLETLAGDIAQARIVGIQPPLSLDPTSWGSILNCLRKIGFITNEEELGLAGVYRFLSPGAHRPIGLPQDQMTRLGRTLALNMCWFLAKLHQANLVTT